MNSKDYFNYPFEQFTVGFDDMFNRLMKDTAMDIKYPPYNIYKMGENSYVIEMAVAGFSEEDLDIVVENNNSRLSIRGRITDQEDESDYYHRGIAKRAFTRSFSLARDIKVKDAKLKNGMLTITLCHESNGEDIRRIEINKPTKTVLTEG